MSNLIYNNLEWSETAKEYMTWEQAVDYCKSLGDGWRFPTIEELTRCIDYSKSDPATNVEGFKSSYYWSSSPFVHKNPSEYVWLVDFYSGHVNIIDKSRGHIYYIRLVRRIK